jgi:hypothetical protein
MITSEYMTEVSVSKHLLSNENSKTLYKYGL